MTAPEGDSAALTEQIIDRFGGIRPMAAKLDTPVTTVQGWKKRGAIPAARHGDIMTAAGREGIALDAAELARTDPGGSAGRADPRPAEGGVDRPAEMPLTETPTGIRRGGGMALVLSLTSLVVAIGLAAAGWRFYVQPTEKRLAALEARVAATEPGNDLARRLDVLESEIAQRPAGTQQAGAQPGSAAAEGAAGDRIAALEQQIAQIRSDSADAEQVAKRLSELQIASGGRELLAQSIRDIQSSTAATPGEVERLSTQLKAVGLRLDQVDAVLSQRRQRALRAEAVVLAVGQLRTALRSAKPFTKEVAAVHAITTDDREIGALLDQLQPLSDSGVPTRDELRTDFGRLAPDIVRSAVVGDGSSWWRQTLYRVESVISIRRVGQAVPGDKTDAVVARAEAKLDEDDLQGAIDTLRALAGLPADVAAPWIHDAEQRVAADRAESELTRLAINRVSSGNEGGSGTAAANRPAQAAPEAAPQESPAPEPRLQEPKPQEPRP